MHQHISQHNKENQRILIAVVLNFMICLVEVIGGLWSGSLALLADALHNFSDGMAILISYLARKIGMRLPDLKMTFGYKRAEILAALLNSSVIIVIAFFLFKEAFVRFKEPQEITVALMIGVGGFGFIADLISVYLLHPQIQKSLNIRSAYLHLLSDTLASVAVVVGGIIIYYYRFYLIDPILTILIGLFILIQGYQVLKQSVSILMERVPIAIDIKDIKKKIGQVPQINNIHHIHVWQIDEKRVLFEGHVVLDEDMKMSEAEKIRRKVEEILKSDFHISHLSIQLEFSYCTDQECMTCNSD